MPSTPAVPPLLSDARLRPVRALAHQTDADTLNDQLELVVIPSPPFGEETRGARLAERFREIGLAGVRRDGEGNVIGSIPGANGDPRPIVVAAHLDTVFAAGTDLTPRRENGRIYVPGITDNARGLAGMLAVARVLARAGVRPKRPVVFVGTVGEEGAGDLRGVKHLFGEGGELRQAAGFIALDGSGLRRIVHRAIGSRRLRVEVAGPGGHSWADRGAANPIVALGAAAAEIAALALPEPTRTALTVARIGGGTSINAIPGGAWMELDMRSEAPGVLPRLEESVRAVLARVVERENAGRHKNTEPLTSAVAVIGDRPSGQTQPREPLVQAASAITYGLGQKPELVGSSTDANVPMALGIPSIAIGVGGDSGGIHTTDEWYSNENGALGVERALLIILAAAGVEA
ncbi:M20/M25/M40 family metallo-hydrolase [Longimicrobium sp.]|uniref:M20/M25/M40 family metallo-hydrolase n=1 Tax=Longimicrobium sp. TaxID=2029185 RepID=UPI002C56E295|nr:M20/M25/M40 family metallo-hydrolase [Longimicrobium sp.]HSU17151.1 M20/M25/M40 family metallo-hydrolase [Longimicrobium sp.]